MNNSKRSVVMAVMLISGLLFLRAGFGADTKAVQAPANPVSKVIGTFVSCDTNAKMITIKLSSGVTQQVAVPATAIIVHGDKNLKMTELKTDEKLVVVSENHVVKRIRVIEKKPPIPTGKRKSVTK